METEPTSYAIRVLGQLGPEWSEWFDGLTIICDEHGETTFSGQIRDQAALYGILSKIQALGLPLLSVMREASPSSKRKTLST